VIYVDSPFGIPVDHPTAPRCFKGRQSAHLMADTESELIAYARKIGMRTSWIQKPGTIRAHFDVTGTFLSRVIEDPSVRQLSAREMVVMFRQPQRTNEGPQ
jgi:Protein of unknown function (DUF4031)